MAGLVPAIHALIKTRVTSMDIAMRDNAHGLHVCFARNEFIWWRQKILDHTQPADFASSVSDSLDHYDPPASSLFESRRIGYPDVMAPKTHTIEVDAITAGTVKVRARSERPWSPAALEEDARRLAEFERTREGVPWTEVKAWLESWGTSCSLSAPKARKLP